jgi:hypothetical protein
MIMDKESKIISEKAAKIGDTLASKLSREIPDFGTKLAIGAAITVGAATILDTIMSTQDRWRGHKQQRIQQRDYEEQEADYAKYKTEAYNYQLEPEIPLEQQRQVLDTYAGLPQHLYSQRTGHTNSWGGRKY